MTKVINLAGALLCLCFALPALGVQLCGNYDAINVLSYRVNNNVWNDVQWSQCIDVDTASGAFNLTRSIHNKPTNGAPAAYPFIFRGCHWGSCTSYSGLPKQVGLLNYVKSSWAFTVPVTGVFNVSYDIWFNTMPTTTGQPDGAELMVWLYKQGPIQPIGSMVASGVLLPSVPGLWNIWIGGRVISYVPQTQILGVSNLRLKSFIDDAQVRGMVNWRWYLIGIDAGFEIWQGGGGLRTTAFSAYVL